MSAVLAVWVAWLDRLGRTGARWGVAWWRIAARAPRGGARIIAAVWLWVRGTYDGAPKTAAEATARGKALLVRLGCAGLLGLVALVVVLGTLGNLPTWTLLPVLAVVLLLLGLLGRPRTAEGAPAAAATREQDAVAEALTKVLPGVSDPAQLRVSPLRDVYAEDAGRIGRMFEIGLPLGVTADKVAPHRAVLAQSLGSKTDRITVTEGTNPGQAVVFVADKSPSEIPPAGWPLAGADSFDLTRPVPIGESLADRSPVGVELFTRDSDGDLQAHHAIVFGATGSGKSNLVRMLVLAAIMDNSATVCVAQKEGSKDFRDLRASLDWLGDVTDRDGVRAMLERAIERMKQVRAGAPAAPWLLVIDEAHAVLSGDKKRADPEIVHLTKTLLAEGRDAAICVVIVTQRPVSASLNQEIAQRPPNRLAFAVNGSTDAELAMGAQLNDRNSPMGAPRYTVGVHINGDLDARVRVPAVNAAEAARLAASHPREPFPIEPEFPAYAPDAESPVQDPEPDPTDTIVHHIDAAWTAKLGDGIDRATADTLALILSTIDPRYYDATGADVRAELKAAGIADRSIKGLVPGDPTKTARGYYRADFTKALRGVSL